MVFEIEGQFQQFIHCKFRENITRLLYIPSVEDGNVFLVVNKYGKVGLYEPQKFTLLLTYILDLTVPMHPEKSRRLYLLQSGKREYQQQMPKCEKTHLIVDAIYASDVKSVVFATTKGILQWYDIGEIESQSIGLETLPRKQYMNLKYGVSPVPLRNKGHAETHRIFGLPEIPYCMEYSCANTTKIVEKNVEIVGKSVSKLLIGDLEGCITIISIKDPKLPFGKRKIRGKLHNIKMQDLFHSGIVKIYKAHNDLVKEIRFISPRQLIISCSRDKKFSIFVQDCTEAIDPFIISLSKGINTLAHSDALKIVATGSDDAIIRLFNQFAIKMPQMELYGHKSSIVNVEFINTAFTDSPILISFSKDVELRAWDPVTYVCLQSVYVSFPVKSTIMCKTPEFAKKSLIIYQPNYNKLEPISDLFDKKPSKPDLNQGEAKSQDNINSYFRKGQDGYIILLYCNSFAKLYIEKDKAQWPFDFEDFLSEFEEMSSSYENKISRKQETETKDPRKLKLSENEVIEIESKLDNYVKEILDIKNRVDKKLGANLQDVLSKKSSIVGLRQPAKVKENKLPPSLLKSHSHITAFKSLPLYQLQPVELSTKNLPIPEIMKEEMGIDRITSTSDLFSHKAQKYFSSPANIQALSEIEAAKSKPPSIPPTPISPSSKESSSVVDESYKISHSSLPFKTKQNNFENIREDDLSSISSLMSNTGVISDNDATAASDGDVDDDDNGDSKEIAKEYETNDFQGKLQKMVASYQDTLQEQLQIPCNINTNYDEVEKYRKGKKMPMNTSSSDTNDDLNEY